MFLLRLAQPDRALRAEVVAAIRIAAPVPRPPNLRLELLQDFDATGVHLAPLPKSNQIANRDGLNERDPDANHPGSPFYSTGVHYSLTPLK